MLAGWSPMGRKEVCKLLQTRSTAVPLAAVAATDLCVCSCTVPLSVSQRYSSCASPDFRPRACRAAAVRSG
nr:hypothetical protein CFP56_16551 [Quercus suber]